MHITYLQYPKIKIRVPKASEQPSLAILAARRAMRRAAVFSRSLTNSATEQNFHENLARRPQQPR